MRSTARQTWQHRKLRMWVRDAFSLTPALRPVQRDATPPLQPFQQLRVTKTVKNGFKWLPAVLHRARSRGVNDIGNSLGKTWQDALFHCGAECRRCRRPA